MREKCIFFSNSTRPRIGTWRERRLFVVVLDSLMDLAPLFPATIIPWNARCVTDYEFLLHLNVCMFSVYSFPSLILLPLQPLGRLCAQLGNKKAQR